MAILLFLYRKSLITIFNHRKSSKLDHTFVIYIPRLPITGRQNVNLYNSNFACKSKFQKLYVYDDLVQSKTLYPIELVYKHTR